MIQLKKLLFVGSLLALTSCGNKALKDMAATEKYADDSTVVNNSPAKALVVVPHGGDAALMAGTIALLDSNGWQTAILTFPSADSLINQRHMQACSYVCDTAYFMSMRMEDVRNDLATNKSPFLPFPREKFGQVYDLDAISSELTRWINDFGPGLIFTLDDSIGGTGHPDHVMLSSMVRELAENGQIRPKKIYQGVHCDAMEKEVIQKGLIRRLDKWGQPNPFNIAKGVYGASGMPKPDVQINFSEVEEFKLYFLESYGRGSGSDIGSFMHNFELSSIKKYHNKFQNEYFRVISF